MFKTTSYYYNSEKHANLQLVADAVARLKERLDNNPTDWVVVRQVKSDGADGWIFSGAALTDDEIQNIDASLYYSVNALHDGNTYIGLSGTEATAQIADCRASYARWLGVNTITKVITEEIKPTNHDMSAYTS